LDELKIDGGYQIYLLLVCFREYYRLSNQGDFEVGSACHARARSVKVVQSQVRISVVPSVGSVILCFPPDPLYALQ